MGRRRLRRKLAEGICVYCGRQASTLDHVVPDCLILDSATELVLPACRECNSEKSKVDEYLRDFFAIRAELYNVKELSKITGAMIRSLDGCDRLGRPRISPARKILSTMASELVRSPLGYVVRSRTIVSAEEQKIRRALLWIVRGLHFHHSNNIVDPTEDFSWWHLNGTLNRTVFDGAWSTDRLGGPFAIGDCVVYKAAMIQENPQSSFWMFVFFNRIFIQCNLNMKPLAEALSKQEAPGSVPGA